MNARDTWEEAVRKERAMEIMDVYTFETDEDGIIRIYKGSGKDSSKARHEVA